MMEPAPRSAARTALARRLRELRGSGFPGVRVTQADLARALSQVEPVANSTPGSWENASALPKRERLSNYAQFFATPRSMEGRPHLVPLQDLDPAEQQKREDLERELFKLWDGDLPPPVSPPGAPVLALRRAANNYLL